MTATIAATLSVAPSHADCCAVVELRQYELKPGQRDVLIDMFDSIFVEAQEAAGNTIIGQFRDLDRPDRFVWFRGFPDMASRAKTLDGFYTSATWQRHRNAANATMIDVSDVLLLRPLKPLPLGKRPRDEAATGIVEVTIYAFDATADVDTIARINDDIEAAGEAAIASYITEKSANNYPRLPIRENENVLVRVATFRSIAAHDEHRAKRAASPRWQALRTKLKSDPQILRLTPTARSLIHG